MRLTGRISELSVEDREAVRAVINASNRQAYRSIIPVEHFREEVLSRPEIAKLFEAMTFYGYWHDEELAGVAALTAEPEGVAQMRWVYVHPQFQRLGVGTALVRHLEGRAQKAGLVKMRLLTADKADWSISFYRKLGYRVTGEIPRPWGSDVEMQKDLRLAT